MMQITRTGFVRSLSQSELDTLRSHFQTHHFVRLSQLLEPTLLNLIQKRLETAKFQERGQQEYFESYMTDESLRAILLFLANDPDFFEVVQQLTGFSKITAFVGRVYRKLPGRGHFDCWHSDVLGGRLVGMSINLSRHVYSGGSLKIRDAESKKVLENVVNTGFGDAILFQISTLLQHRIEKIRGKAAKIAFAGWFVSGSPVLQFGAVPPNAGDGPFEHGGSPG